MSRDGTGTLLLRVTTAALLGCAVVLAPAARAGDRAAEREKDAESSKRLKRLATGLLMYAMDYNQKLPAMKSPAAVKKALMPYVKDASAFLDPRTGKPYSTNATLSGKTSRAASGMIAFYEAEPAPDGRRGVAFVSGTVWRMKPESWSKYSQKSGIAEQP